MDRARGVLLPLASGFRLRAVECQVAGCAIEARLCLLQECNTIGVEMVKAAAYLTRHCPSRWWIILSLLAA